MPEQPANPYGFWDFPSVFEPKFTNAHIVTRTSREFILSFGVAHPPNERITPVVQLVMTKEHLLELVLNLQAQLKNSGEGSRSGA